ncbi:hypothetical protein ACFLWR_03310 [Chloroflexota bacterium]
MILSYPRLIDHIVNFEKIEDQQLVRDIDKLGRESLGHFAKMDLMMRNLGGVIAWKPSALPRLVGITDELEKQLLKEKTAHDLYSEAREVAKANKNTIKVGGIINKLKGIDISDLNIVYYDRIIGGLERLILDEERHIRVVEDSLATCKTLKE